MYKIAVDSKKLLDLLNKTMRIVQVKSPISLYYSGLFKVRNNILTIQVTDNDHTLIVHMDVEGDDMEFIIKVQDIFELTKKMNGIITFIKNENNKVKIQFNNTKIELLLLEEIFLDKSDDTSNSLVKISKEELDNLFGFVNMTNDLWNFKLQTFKDRIESIGTDRKRLVFSKINIKDGNESENYSISYKSILLLCKNINSDVEILTCNKEILFKFNNGILFCKILDQRIVDHNRIFGKKENTNPITVDCKSMLNSLNRVNLLSSKISRSIKIIFEENSITMYASDVSKGQAEEVIYLNYKNENLGYLFINCDYLISALKTINDENVEIYYTGNMSHFFVCSKNITHIIMPIIMHNK